MREVIEPHFYLVERAKAAMEELGITPRIAPIRGGTDGARLSYMGLPCPNLCAGGHKCHGKYEYVSVESMERIVELLVRASPGFPIGLGVCGHSCTLRGILRSILKRDYVQMVYLTFVIRSLFLTLLYTENYGPL